MTNIIRYTHSHCSSLCRAVGPPPGPPSTRTRSPPPVANSGVDCRAAPRSARLHVAVTVPSVSTAAQGTSPDRTDTSLSPLHSRSKPELNRLLAIHLGLADQYHISAQLREGHPKRPGGMECPENTHFRTLFIALDARLKEAFPKKRSTFKSSPPVSRAKLNRGRLLCLDAERPRMTDHVRWRAGLMGTALVLCLPCWAAAFHLSSRAAVH